MTSVEYVVPLLTLDRSILDRIESILHSFDVPEAVPTSADQCDVFRLWVWTIRITESLHEDLDEEKLDENYDGDRNAAYAEALNFLRRSHGPPLAANIFRVNALEEANPSFLAELGDRPAQDVKCVPASDDMHYWSLLQSIYSHGKLKLRKASMFQRTEAFDVWEAMQMLLIQSRMIQNASELYLNVVKHPIFTSLYEFRPKSRPQEGHTPARISGILDADRERYYKEMATDAGATEQAWEISHRRSHGQMDRWPDNKPKYDADQKITNDYLDYQLRELGRQKILEDPRNYLHMVPWSQLESISWQSVEKIVEIDDPFDEIRQSTQTFGYMLWEPPSAAFKWLHHLRTEEEVLQYCIAKNWTLPGYSYDEEAELVLFAIKPIEETLIFKQLGQYWDLWNDCAITVRTDDQQIFLLETVPGLQFRSRVEHQDIQAALKYFRNIIEAHHAGTLHQRTVVDLLGPENALPYFDKSLQIIPQTQLSEVSSNPIGHGANGAVYAALWQRTPGALATTNRAASQISVVLKEILPVGRGVNTLQRLLRELNLTYLALAGSSVGCVDFMGVTTLSGLEHDPIPPEVGHNTDRRLLLVFERATEGSLLEYLDRVLPGLSFMQAWDKINGVVSNIANGLSSLHKHNVIHRDLHPNNVLVARAYYVNDSEDHAIVTDIGEGKVLNTRGVETSAGASYGCSEFRAPEVRGVQGWSSAADVFSFGVLCCKILEMRADVCKAPIPNKLQQLVPVLDGEEIVPEKIRRAVEGCLSREPTDRPSIRSVVTDLDRLSLDFYYEDSGYSSQSALKDEPEELLKQIEWTSWNWRQTLAVAQGAIDAGVPGEYRTRDSILDEG